MATTKTKDMEQAILNLAPDGPPDLEAMDLRAEDLVVRDFPKPNAGLRMAIKNWGILQAVLVHRDGEKLVVVDGNRRVLAAREAERLVPCLVTNDLGYLKHVATLMLNNTRERNILAEEEAIDELLAKGATVQDVAKMTGTTKAIVEKRLRLKKLSPEIRQMVKDGKVASGVAEQIVKLSPSEQAELVKGAMADREYGDPDAKDLKITADDVKAVRRAVAQQTALSIDPKVFESTYDMASARVTFSEVRLESFVRSVRGDGMALNDVIKQIRGEWKKQIAQEKPAKGDADGA